MDSKVYISRKDSVVGLKQTSKIHITVEGERGVVDEVEDVVREIAAKEIAKD